ncbi:hypothetical protein PR202_gb04640 [Eleusine coracana subsp. coracana]|uniref:Uncharacterized protein n=1 Tax=Eleusine coracana subsp. coracana TaxID=191504 RepID=A0AAV5E576_ELECO|nr:hypothetical protein PR202_gb04640 [Eleusine coracana subsp. coracana]
MDFPKRRGPRATRPGGGAMEADENVDPATPVPAGKGNASPLRKKVLGERNGGGEGAMEAATPPPQPKPVPSPPTLTGRGAGPYDPKTNCTTPRPEFLRYDPERHREMLLRLARSAEMASESDCSSAASGTAASEAAGSSVSSAPDSDSEAEIDHSDDEEEEEEVVPAGRGRWARRLFLLLVAVACSCCYIYCMIPTPYSVHSEDGLAFTGPIGGMYDADVHELDSLRLLGLGSHYMMGPEDVLDEIACPIVQGGSEGAVHQYDRRAASRNLMAIAMMGLADLCPNVQLGESACRIGDVNVDNVDDLKKNPELSEQNAAVMMEGDSSGLVYQEEGEGYSDQFVPELVSMEKAVQSASDKVDGTMGLESKGLHLETELLQYEQTAEAAKEMCSKVKFLWSALEPHLLWILASSFVAGLVATMFKYYPRSREITVPASEQMSSKSLKEVPVLVPHQPVQLPVSPSPLAVQLQVPNQDLSGRLDVPMQLPLPKLGPLALPKTEPVQKLEKGDAELKASHGTHFKRREGRDDDIFETLKSSSQQGDFSLSKT